MNMLKISLLKNLTLLLVEDDEELRSSIKETFHYTTKLGNVL